MNDCILDRQNTLSDVENVLYQQLIRMPHPLNELALFVTILLFTMCV